ncbi:MAG: hypothetical protein N4A35_12260 [Flavobacteriales bacterium]|jgi:hypothetical protein|nr:hypothetical protein [Flavobacteriales bacterium]
MKLNWKSWGWLRVVRLILGVSFVGQAIDTKEWFLLPIGLFLLYQVYTNAGCASCETDQCSIPE